jgi:hypothetical protein
MAARTSAAYDMGFLVSLLLIAAGGLVFVILKGTGSKARKENK